MKQKINNEENLIKQSGPVWKIKVAVYSSVRKEKNGFKAGVKRWKIKEILN